MKVMQLARYLAKINYDDYAVLLSSDEEGNSFSQIDKSCISVDEEKKVVILYPNGLQTDDIEHLLLSKI
jgi:hypothetical protein